MFPFLKINALSFSAGVSDVSALLNVNATQYKIASFAELPQGWHYGEGAAPSQDAIINAQNWLRHLIAYGFSITDAFPGADGEIMLAAYNNQQSLEVTIESDSTISLCYEVNDEIAISLSHSMPNDVISAIEHIARKLWSTLDSSTKCILIPEKTVSLAWHLRILEGAGQSFNTIAFSGPDYRYATIFENTIIQSPEIPQYSGALTQRTSRILAL